MDRLAQNPAAAALRNTASLCKRVGPGSRYAWPGRLSVGYAAPCRAAGRISLKVKHGLTTHSASPRAERSADPGPLTPRAVMLRQSGQACQNPAAAALRNTASLCKRVGPGSRYAWPGRLCAGYAAPCRAAGRISLKVKHGLTTHSASPRAERSADPGSTRFQSGKSETRRVDLQAILLSRR